MKCLVLLLAVLLPLAGSKAQKPGAPTPDQVLVNAINAVQLVERLPRLTINPNLTAAAVAHASDMAERGFFAHKDPDGRGLKARLDTAGYAFALASEVIATGQRDPQIVLADWLDSDAHRKNLLDRNIRDIGCAYLYYPSDPAISRHRHYWVVVLGRPETASRQEQANAKR